MCIAMQTLGEHTEHVLVPYLVPLQEAIQLADFHGWSILVYVAEL
jgi:hypothetical protein